MATGDKRISFYLKKFLSVDQVENNLFDYLKNFFAAYLAQKEPVSGIWIPDPLVFAGGSGTGLFTVAPSENVVLLDNAGNTLDLLSSVGVDIPFENANLVNYYVGAKYISIPDEAETNPRYDTPKWKLYRDAVGELDEPDSISDQGGGVFRFIVNSATESGVDHSGRTCRIYLKTPVDLGDNYEEATIVYSGGNNYVDISTGGAIGDISTDETLYYAVVEGYTWKRNTDLSTVPAYAYLGTVQGKTGSPPDTFNYTGQFFLKADVTRTEFDNLENAFKLEHSYDPGSGDHSDVTADSLSGKADTTLPIESDSNVTIDIDHDNDETDREFIVSHNNGAETLLTVNEDGDVLDKNGASLGGWHGSPDRIKLTPSMFGSSNASATLLTNGGYAEVLSGADSVIVTVEIPKGFQATAVMVYGTGVGNAVTAYDCDINTNTATSLNSGVLGTEFSISLTADSTNYLSIVVTGSGAKRVHGGYVTIAKV